MILKLNIEPGVIVPHRPPSPEVNELVLVWDLTHSDPKLMRWDGKVFKEDQLCMHGPLTIEPAGIIAWMRIPAVDPEKLEAA